MQDEYEHEPDFDEQEALNEVHFDHREDEQWRLESARLRPDDPRWRREGARIRQRRTRRAMGRQLRLRRRPPTRFLRLRRPACRPAAYRPPARRTSRVTRAGPSDDPDLAEPEPPGRRLHEE